MYNSGRSKIPAIIQIACIFIGAFGIIASIVNLAKYARGVAPVIRTLFTLLLCVALILVEIYLFPFVKYFGFILKPCGKALVYLFIGGCLFYKKGFPLFCAILYWVLAVIFIIMVFLLPQIALPILQGGYKDYYDLPDLSIDSSTIYQNQPNNSYQSVLNQDIANEIQ